MVFDEELSGDEFGEEEWDEECGRVVKVYVVKASDVAKTLTPPPVGDVVLMKFGKIFEEEYALANHIYNMTMYQQVSKWFMRKIAARLRAEGIYRRDLVVKAYRAYSALINAGVTGLKPRTVFKRIGERLYVSAQPDLYDESTKTYYEFKLYPINEYARKQAGVFAWVLGKPVVLIGLREDERGYISVEREVVDPPVELEVDVSELLKMAVVEEFCEKLEIPLFQYERECVKRARYARFIRFLEDDEDFYEDN